MGGCLAGVWCGLGFGGVVWGCCLGGFLLVVVSACDLFFVWGLVVLVGVVVLFGVFGGVGAGMEGFGGGVVVCVVCVVFVGCVVVFGCVWCFGCLCVVVLEVL
ncbi:hypothetical protein [Pseudomonas syringae group genomosp. 7]|uniref:hypothetical protein n=1 Tax=Pseudomonas syringae group genomosp. 7 TaxID=251699 RepID=UPI003770521B